MNFARLLAQSCALAGASVIAAKAGWADEVVTGNRTIYNGNELTGYVTLYGANIYYGTVGVEDVLQGELLIPLGETATISVTPTSTLHIDVGLFQAGATLNLGTSTATGTIVIDGFGGIPSLNAPSVNINGGTVVVGGSATFPWGVTPISINNEATLELNGTGLVSLLDLSGDGTVDGNGSRVWVNGGLFEGTITDVAELSFTTTALPGPTGPVTVGRNATLRGRLENIGSLYVGSSVSLEASGVGLGADISLIDEVTIHGTMDLGLESATLHNLNGSGRVGTGGNLTIVDADYGGIFQAAGGITFEGSNVFSGTWEGGAVTVAAGGELSTTNSSVFNDTTLMTVNGLYEVVESATIGSLSGAGSVYIGPGETFSVAGTAPSSFSGSIAGNGALQKSGSGTLTLTGTSSYSGGTTITGGTLAGDTDSLQGDIGNYGGNLSFDQATDGAFSGYIFGYGTLEKLGSGELRMTGANSFSGTTIVSDGRMVVSTSSVGGNIVNNSELVFEQDFFGSFGGNISGTGDFRKSGSGTLVLTGNGSYTGTTEILDGTLVVNGSLASDITVHDGAFLGGNGSVQSLWISSGATLAPGNSIGTVTVVGNADFAAGSVYAVEVDALGNSDLLSVGGLLSIAPTASVSVGPENGIDSGANYNAPVTYTIATASGGISGMFGSVTDSFAYLVPSLSYDAYNVYLTLERLSFVDAGGTPNEQAIGEAVDSISGGPVADALLLVTDDEREAALRALSGEVHASLHRGLIDEGLQHQDAVLSHLLDGDGGRFWTTAHGGRSAYSGDGNAGGFSQSGGAVLFGADVLRTDDITFGVLAGYGSTSIHLDGTPSRASTDSFHAGVYGSWRNDELTLRFGNIWSLHDISTRRTVDFSTLSEQLTADYGAMTSLTFIEASHEVDLGPLSVEPFMGGQFAYHHAQGFEESGGDAALAGRAEDLANGFTTLGMRFSGVVSGQGARAHLFGEVGWRHLFGDDTPAARLAFDSGNPFLIEGAGTARDVGFLKVGARAQFNSALSADLSYSGSFSEDAAAHMLRAGLTLRF